MIKNKKNNAVYVKKTFEIELFLFHRLRVFVAQADKKQKQVINEILKKFLDDIGS